MGPTEAFAQKVPSGAWTGFVTPPGGVPYESTYSVGERGDSLVIRMEVSDWDAEFPFHNISVDGEALHFWWVPIGRVDCELLADDHGVYRGECWDGGGNVAPMVMAPPDHSVDNEIESLRADAEQAKRRNEKWALRRQLDEIEGIRGDMVDVGGTELNVLIEGNGAATVVLLSDVGDDLRTWDYVVHDVKEFARVVAYSREGTGYSKTDSSKATVERAVVNLRGLLDAAKLAPPYILVGHGVGALFGQAFVSAYPGQVAGLVFVDPLLSELADRLEELDAASWKTYWEGKKTIYGMADDPIRDEYALYQRWVEGRGLDGIGDLPDVPVAVISGLRPSASPRWIVEQKKGLDARREVHEALAGRYEEGMHRTTLRSGHYIQREDPDLLVEVIREIVGDHPTVESVPN